MEYNIRGDKLEVTDAIYNYVVNKLGRLDKYFKNSNIKVNVNLRVKGKDQVIEVTIRTDKLILRAEDNNTDLYAAIDLVVDKLESQIRKNKDRIKKHTNSSSMKEFNFDYEYESDEEQEDNLDIVKRKKIEMKPMDEEEALLQMELLGHSFFVYKDIDTNSVNVLYVRKDGNFGKIETE